MTKFSAPSVLVAMPQLTDPFFRRSVILLLEHRPAGAVGFAVNRPGLAKLKDIVQIEGLAIPAELPVWQGGPVEAATGVVLSLDARPRVDAAEACIQLSSSTTELADLIRDRRGQKDCLYPYRFMLGYSCWGAGQLDEELRLGAWCQLPFDRELLFNVAWADMWDRTLASFGVQPTDLVATTHTFLN